MEKNIYVQNSEGKEELFSSEKVYRSAINAGADKNLAEKITKEVIKNTYSGIKTSAIFEQVKKLLREENFRASLRFDLKSAMKRLGPTGFPFEKYVKSIFESRGFKTKINIYIKGKCVVHEIDFLAEKGREAYFGECKYRNIFDSAVGVNTALSNYARFLDLKQGLFFKKFSKLKTESILVTNAKFTNQAIQYSNCMKVKLLGWKYPKKQGLEKIIEDYKLYPITILPSLSVEMADIFTSEEKMLANEVLKINFNEFSKKTKIPVEKLEKLKKEAEILIEEKN